MNGSINSLKDRCPRPIYIILTLIFIGSLSLCLCVPIPNKWKKHRKLESDRCDIGPQKTTKLYKQVAMNM